MKKYEFSSVSAVVAFFGLRQLAESLARCVLDVPASPSLPAAARVAAACPVWAGRFVAYGLCSWRVAWAVACSVARVFGVKPSSGGALWVCCSPLPIV